jgi:diguanylate cyclase (GGDEF)-like protein
VLAARIRVAARTRRREEKLESETRVLRVVALTDPLTGLGNRRAFEGDLEREWARMRRSDRSLALLILDVDRFKQVNDRYGHRAGDRILLGVAQAIAAEVRASDSASRFGGDEFAILAPEAGAEGAAVLAERIRLRIATLGGAGTAVATASVGVAIAPSSGIDSAEGLIKAADDALYAAKREGRNRVSSALVA